MEKKCIIACKVLWREISYLVSKSPYFYHVEYLDQGLHNTPSELQKKLQDKISLLEKEYSTILIGYGLCSNGISGIKSDNARLVIMRGHDCITFYLGSKERYRQYFDENPGTYWYNTGWIETSSIPSQEYYEGKHKEFVQQYDEDTADYLIDLEKEWLKKYRNLAYIHQGITKEDEYIEFSKSAAQYLSWDFFQLDGNISLMYDWINCNWDDERFLILEKGQTLIPSFNEKTIITADISS